MASEPVDVVEGVVDGVVASVAGGVATDAVSGGVDDHESFFGLGGLHGGGLTDEGYVYLGEQGYDAFDALGSADFFFGAGEEDEVVAEGVALGEYVVGCEEADYRGSVVVAAEPVEGVAFDGGLVGWACPCADGLDGVDVGVEEEGGAMWVVVWVDGPDVVVVA